eukprot:g7637.t1
MLASATEVEVELHVPDDVSTFFGVTWAQDPRKDKIFIKAFPRGSDGRRGILESTGLVEINDCLTAINGVPLDKSSGLHEVMASIRAAKSPLSLRFARYPPPRPRFASSSSSSLFSASAVPALSSAVAGAAADKASSPTGTDSLGGGGGGGTYSVGARARAGTGDAEKRETADPELDDVLNSALVLGLGERVADIQKRNAQLVQQVDRIGRAAADKRQGVERVAASVASLTAAGTKLLPQQALQLLSVARQDAVALCGAMARLDDLLAARERAQMARRRTLEQEDWRGRGALGGESSAGGGGDDGGGGGGGGGVGLGAGSSGIDGSRMREARAAGGGGAARLLPATSSTPAVLVATALLLGCAVPSLPSASAASAGRIPAPSSASLATLRRSGQQHHSRQDEELRRGSSVPLTTAAAPRGGGSGRARSPSWFTAQATRGGGIFRRRRGGGGDGGDEGRGPGSNGADGGAGGEEAGRDDEEKDGKSEGFAVAAGTTGGGGDDGAGSSSADGQKEEEEEEEDEGGVVESEDEGGRKGDDEDEPSGAVLTDENDDQSGGSGESRTEDASEETEEEAGSEAEGTDSEEEEGAEKEGAPTAATAQEGERRRPVAPLFSFPPAPRVQRTEAEESLQEVLPMQQRLVKYLTEDRIFGAQILCSVYFFMSAVAYSVDSVKFRGCYQAALAALTLKHWGTVLGRVRRVLVPHLLYEPQRYVKYRARVAALALDPAVQGIVYCAIFMLMPLGHALLPLLLKESVYLLWVIKEVLQIAAPGVVEVLTSLLEPLMAVFMTAGDVEKWRGTPAGEKRLLLGRRLAQVCFKLEMMMPFSVALRVLPGAVQASLAAGTAVMEAAAAGSAEQAGGAIGEGIANGAVGAAAGGGVYGQIARVLPLIKVGMLMMVYVKLLTVKNGQLEDDVRILRGLKIRGYNCEWLEQAADSVVFGKMVGCPWWVGLLASAFALLPNHEATKNVMSSNDKLKTLGMTLLNLAIGRTPGAEDDDEDESESSHADSDGEDPPVPKTRMAKLAKVASVATGISDF